ncbi:uncharacterized protein LY79DRAFT_668261 [Colletotrichum navitas]|uniref:Uncharacterized protein n=1 Tax=Colletotrichum navitas TaxID=681940 RepID=A0AAD8Q4R3_9PEZI|nr:uncharacterized protein LY79DRAFT_668261 [Colletotrichum navitas]KAK1595047.1 hypothetical protein LY79DRAFT_668261 [Colletotrichum navitas]
MATPRPRGAGDEILSSPDPLNDTVSSALYPSSRRVTRSQRSQRLFSIGGRGTSPRKQMFELEVGDDSAPKRLLVTVEAEGEYENVGRRLFNADTPTLSRGAYTTTVPLAGDKKNTAVKTPARRGRPPKSGTPKTGTATKRRATSSPKKTPRQTRRVKTIVDSDGIEADITIQGTPKPTTRTKRTTSRQPRGASEDPAPSSRPSTTRGRGRPKRVEFSDQPVETVDEVADFGGVAPSDDALAAVMEDMAVDDPTPRREQPAVSIPESEPDIWMQTMSDQATPRATTQDNPITLSPTPAYLQDKSPTPSEQLHSESGNEPEYNDYDFGPGAASDISSLIGENDADKELRDQDTVAQGEDFSMIFANSIPSMRGHTSMLAPGSEIGEETGLIVNQTLESLRQSGALRVDNDDDDDDDNDEEDDEVVGLPTTQEAPVHNLPAHEEIQPAKEAEPHMVSVIDLDAEVNESPVALPSLPRPDLPPPSSTSRDKSPVRSTQSPGRARSSPRRKSIPLGRKLFENKARQIELETSRIETSHMETSQMETSRMDASFSSVPSQILAAATPGTKASRRASMANEEASVAYEDEFSEIPDAYLEAATPGKLIVPQVDKDEGETMNVTEDNIQEEMDEGVEDGIEEPHADQAEVEDEEEAAEEARKSSPKSAAPSNASVSYTRSDSARMPTPDDTPSPNDVPVPQSDAKTIEAPQSSPPAEYPQHDEMSSDPPVPELTTNAPAATSEYITPVAPVSSPVPSPDVNLLAPRASSPDNGVRPALSPIVRAGRALQSVTSDASSPPRQNSLGSPFRPTTSSSQPQSAAKSIRSWTQPLSTLIQAGAQFFGSPTRAPAPPPPPPSVPQSTGAPYEDPFGHEDDHTGQPSFMEALAKSMIVPRTEEQGEASVSMSGSLQVAPADEADEMSWMEEAPAPREQPFTQSRSMQSSTNAAGASLTSRRPSFEGLSLTFDGADETEVEEEQAGEHEDDDIWAIEASRPASSSSRQQSFGKRSIAPVPPRRMALPSPWQGRAESPNKNTLFTPAASHNRKSGFDEAEEEDFSMLSQQRSQKQLPRKAFGVAQISSAKKDLSAFFSSPALLPGAEGVKEIMDKKRQNALSSKNMTHPPEQFNAGIETNSMFPSIPQKAFSPSVSGRSDLFSPAKPSATKSTTDTRRELFSSTMSRTNVRQPSEIPDSQINMSSEVSFTSVPQKNFIPKSGQKTQDLFSKAAAPVPSLTPVRMQLTRADIQKWQESSASAIAEDSPESERRILRPLPDRNMSPTKSCLRSPLKPRTPGRVVEFTSSVLSPLAQAQVRAGRRLSSNSNSSADAAQQQQQQQQRINAIMEEEDKENDTAMGDASDAQHEEMDVFMMDAPDAGSSLKPAAGEEPRLSQTMWSRDHWLLLDDIIQLRRLGPFDFQFPNDFQSKSGWLLGRSVNSHGISLVMEQWHLDVVDAFKAEVGGWEEEVLAKRVFSLVVGEQLRKEGKAPKAPSVKFA